MLIARSFPYLTVDFGSFAVLRELRTPNWPVATVSPSFVKQLTVLPWYAPWKRCNSFPRGICNTLNCTVFVCLLWLGFMSFVNVKTRLRGSYYHRIIDSQPVVSRSSWWQYEPRERFQMLTKLITHIGLAECPTKEFQEVWEVLAT
jgi:hypothetical protein